MRHGPRAASAMRGCRWRAGGPSAIGGRTRYRGPRSMSFDLLDEVPLELQARAALEERLQPDQGHVELLGDRARREAFGGNVARDLDVDLLERRLVHRRD